MLQYNPSITGSLQVTGSLVVTGNIISSGSITISGSVASASYAEFLGGLPSSSFASASVFNTVSSSYAAASASLSTRVTTLESASGSFAAQSASLSTRVTNLEATSSTVSSSFASTSGSIAGRVTCIEGQYATTGSNNFSGRQYVSDVSNAIGFTSTASIYTDGGLRVTKDSFVSGTAYFNNVVVYGTSSIQYITSSQLNIGTNIINLNTDTPAIRFGGLAVADSGSNAGITGSLLWDSQNNRWIYSNPSGSTYDGGMLMSGPRNTTGLGNEVGTTACAVMIGQGGDHITSSGIFSYGNATCFYGTSLISGSGEACFSSTVCSLTLASNAICSNTIFSTGSNVFGSIVTNTQRVTGSLGLTGSLAVNVSTNIGSSGESITVGAVGINTVAVRRTIASASGSSRILFQAVDNSSVGQNTAIVEGGLEGVSSNSYLSFYTTFPGGSITEKMRINSSGSVGIGTCNPAYLLEVSAAPAATSSQIFTRIGRTSSANNAIGDYVGIGPNAVTQVGAVYRSADSWGIEFLTNSGATNVMRLNYDGKVGINTTAPDLTLTVSGSMNLRNSTRAGAFEIDSSGNLWIGTATTAGNIYLETGHTTAGLPSTGTARLTLNSTAATFSNTVCANRFYTSGIGTFLSAVCTGYGITFCDIGDTRFLQSYAGTAATYNAASDNTVNKIVVGHSYNWYSECWMMGATRGSGADIASFVLGRNGATNMVIAPGGIACFSSAICAGTSIYMTGATPNLNFVTNTSVTTTMFQILGTSYVGTPPFGCNRISALNSSHISLETGGSTRMLINNAGQIGLEVGTFNLTGTYQNLLSIPVQSWGILSVVSNSGGTYSMWAIVNQAGSTSPVLIGGNNININATGASGVVIQLKSTNGATYSDLNWSYFRFT